MRDALVNIRKTNPTLWLNSMAIALCSLLLSVNFLKYLPAFSPFGIPKWVPEIMFGVLGVWQLVFLTVRPNLQKLRIGQTGALIAAIFWGTANTQQTRTFGGTASWQLPIMLAFYAAIVAIAIFAPPINLLTEKK